MVAAFLHISINSLKSAKLAPEKLDSGSGQVDGTLVLTAMAMGPITAPYGTADNTYSTADQFPSLIMTALPTPIGSTIIGVQKLDPKLAPEVYVDAFVTTQTGQIIQVFPPFTKVVTVDFISNTFTVDQATVVFMDNGTEIVAASNFTGTVSQQMDFRADCDPRFQFIARVSPEGYGYTNGYMIGDGTAPNGFPVGSGTTFPSNPSVGDYFLRVDYLPNLLYRWDGALWVRIGESNRAGVAFDTTNPEQQSQLASFINNDATLVLTDGTVIPQQQPLSSILTIQPD